MKPMHTNINGAVRVAVVTNDYDTCRLFYETNFGFPINTEWDRSPGDRGVVYEIGTTHLELLEGDKNSIGDGVYLYIPVEDVDLLYARLSKVMDITTPIATQSWGHRNFGVHDPAGLKLKFYSETSK
jgi:catechol 2,3-dioxygenase-like lactoylglutathione lyase family enzyme